MSNAVAKFVIKHVTGSQLVLNILIYVICMYNNILWKKTAAFIGSWLSSVYKSKKHTLLGHNLSLFSNLSNLSVQFAKQNAVAIII